MSSRLRTGLSSVLLTLLFFTWGGTSTMGSGPGEVTENDTIRSASNESSNTFYANTLASSQTVTEENTEKRNASEFVQQATLPVEEPLDHNARLQELKKIEAGLKQLINETVDDFPFSTGDNITYFLDSIVQLPQSRSPISDDELGAATAITKYLNFMISIFGLRFAIVGGTHHLPSGHGILLWNNAVIFEEQLLYSTDGFSMSANFESAVGVTHMAYVAFPGNVCPLLPLPETKFPITQLQLVQVIILDESRMITVENVAYAGVISIRWVPKRQVSNLQHACAYWNAMTDQWTSEDCVVLKSKDIPRSVSCYCDVSGAEVRSSDYILYEYRDDIESTIHVDQGLLVENISWFDANELQKYKKSLEDIVVGATQSNTLGDYLSQLSIAMRFDHKVLVDTFDDQVLKDIGKILEETEPEDGKSTIGFRNNDLASFVINLDIYEGNPPYGFGVLKNYTSGIEYFRLTQETDDDEIFSMPMAYIMSFSKSVVHEISRYAFLLYPPDKYFNPAAIIDGHEVAAMRVLDLVLTPKKKNSEEYLVNMFIGDIVDTIYLVGCASWSSSFGNWTSTNCHPNPALHNGVCTCKITLNFGKSPTRAQYIVYKYTYATGNIVPDSIVNSIDHKFNAGLAKYVLQQSFKKIDTSSFGESKLKTFFKIASDLKYLKTSDYPEVIHDLRFLILEMECVYNGLESYSDFYIVCSDLYNTSAAPMKDTNNTTEVDAPLNRTIESVIRNKTIGFAKIRKRETLQTYLESNETDFSDVMSPNNSYGLLLSPSVAKYNLTYVFMLYPTMFSFRPISQVKGREIVSFRVVDIIFDDFAYKGTGYDIDHYVEFYLHNPRKLPIGCAFWSEELADWTNRGCKVIEINSVNACNCSLTVKFTSSRSGGQVVVYIYNMTPIFDVGVYEAIGAESFIDATSILKQGAALIHNASQLLKGSDGNFAKQIMHTYHKILAHVSDVKHDKKALKQILNDLEECFKNFFVDPLFMVSILVSIPTTWSVKNTEVSSDLYSNNVLSSGAVGSVSTELSDFALAVIGYKNYNDTLFVNNDIEVKINGLQFYRENNFGGTLANLKGITAVIDANPGFACFVACYDLLKYYRFIFTVYPVNMSPYPPTMSENPVFNSRQVDIYVDTRNVFRKKHIDRFKSVPKCDSIVHVYFQPTEKPNSYIKIGCASWDATHEKWTTSLCTLDIKHNRNVSCSCNITKRKVSRIIMYEYTVLPNFSLVELFRGPSVVFLIGSSFSLFGFILIAATAIFFPAWREELSNKVLLHLASSSFLYLCMTMFRETHLIFADMKRLDVTLVAFTACVHYTRLVHHCWGLAMSVLQYRRFSSVVGASATSHLLLKVSLFAWGVPLVPLFALLSWNLRAHFCTPDTVTHYTLYFVPVIVITALNIGLLVAVIRNITNGCGLWNDDELKKHGGSSKDTLKRQLKQTVMMLFLFGIPTVFEMFNNISSYSIVLDYFGKILNPIEGFMMFIFFVFMNDKTRGLWSVLMFGSEPAPNRRQSTKKIVFKPKTVRRVSRPVQSPTIQPSPEAKQFTKEEPEIQIITSDGWDSGNAVKYVVQLGDEFASREGLCVVQNSEDAETNKKSEGRANEAASDIATIKCCLENV